MRDVSLSEIILKSSSDAIACKQMICFDTSL